MATARPQRLRYVPLETVRRWDRNPKRHELDDLKESFRRHGFRGAIEFDGTLEAVVAGNGRDEALEQMRDAGEDPPRWIPKDKKGRWLIPVIFGIDADSRDAAEQYGVDANSLTLGPGLEVADVARLYDDEMIASLTQGWGSNGEADFSGLVLDFGPPPVAEVEAPGEFPSVDESLPTEHTCPECGYRWSGSA